MSLLILVAVIIGFILTFEKKYKSLGCGIMGVCMLITFITSYLEGSYVFAFIALFLGLLNVMFSIMFHNSSVEDKKKKKEEFLRKIYDNTRH